MSVNLKWVMTALHGNWNVQAQPEQLKKTIKFDNLTDPALPVVS